MSHLPAGCTAVVFRVDAQGFMRRRLFDLGFVPGTEVKAVRESPLGDPRAYLLRGAVYALRNPDAQQIQVVCKGDRYCDHEPHCGSKDGRPLLEKKPPGS